MNQSTMSTSSTSDSTIKASIPGNHNVVDVNWETIYYLWTIKHFEQFHCEVNKRLTSSVFSTDKHPEYKWTLTFYIEPTNSENDGYFGVFLTRCEPTADAPKNVFVEMKFGVLDDEQNEAFIVKSSREFIFESRSWGYPKFILKTKLLDPSERNKFLPEDTLRVFCQVKFALASSAAGDCDSDNSLSISLEHFSRDQDFADVTFSVDGKNFEAHKSILAARSPVFARMFKQDAQQNKRREVSISEMSCKTFENFLIYLYTDKTSADAEMALNLLKAADKYGVGGLKAICEEILWKDLAQDLSAENVISLLTVAHKYRANQLKKHVASYIKKHPSIMTTQRWKNEILARPCLFDYVNAVDKPKEPVVRYASLFDYADRARAVQRKSGPRGNN